MARQALVLLGIEMIHFCQQVLNPLGSCTRAFSVSVVDLELKESDNVHVTHRPEQILERFTVSKLPQGLLGALVQTF